MAAELDLQALGLPPVLEQTPVGGGSINEAWRATLADGRTAFVKHHPWAPAGFFEAEAHSLARLAAAGCLDTPAVLAVGPHYLVLQWIDSAPRSHDFEEQLGERLASLHQVSAGQFGFDCDNFCGLTPQPNPQMPDGHAFFREARLMHQGRMANRTGKLPAADMRRLEQLCQRLESLIPQQSPSLIHGDLWSGNVMTGPKGQPVLIDPATHFGWAEADLAMTCLFGGFGSRFYDSYARTSPSLAPDWEQRVPLYNLYHLLNHLNLFGGGYLQSVRSILSRFA